MILASIAPFWNGPCTCSSILDESAHAIKENSICIRSSEKKCSNIKKSHANFLISNLQLVLPHRSSVTFKLTIASVFILICLKQGSIIFSHGRWRGWRWVKYSYLTGRRRNKWRLNFLLLSLSRYTTRLALGPAIFPISPVSRTKDKTEWDSVNDSQNRWIDRWIENKFAHFLLVMYYYYSSLHAAGWQMNIESIVERQANTIFEERKKKIVREKKKCDSRVTT